MELCGHEPITVNAYLLYQSTTSHIQFPSKLTLKQSLFQSWPRQCHQICKEISILFHSKIIVLTTIFSCVSSFYKQIRLTFYNRFLYDDYKLLYFSTNNHFMTSWVQSINQSTQNRYFAFMYVISCLTKALKCEVDFIKQVCAIIYRLHETL